MSVIIIPGLFLVLNVLIIGSLVADENRQLNEPDNEISIWVFSWYATLLPASTIFTFLTSIYFWLKNGEWTSINPIYISSKLDEGNIINELLLSESSWLGVQKLNEWYIQQNIGWTTLAALILFVFLYIFRYSIWDCKYK